MVGQEPSETIQPRARRDFFGLDRDSADESKCSRSTCSRRERNQHEKAVPDGPVLAGREGSVAAPSETGRGGHSNQTDEKRRQKENSRYTPVVCDLDQHQVCAHAETQQHNHSAAPTGTSHRFPIIVQAGALARVPALAS